MLAPLASFGSLRLVRCIFPRALLVALGVVVPTIAFAAGGGRERYKNDEPGQTTEPEDAAHPRRLVISVDTVLGFGKSTVAQIAQPVGGVIVPRTVLDYRSVFVESWLFGASFDFGRGIGAAVRLPFSYMSFSSDNFRIATSALGNLEVEPSYRRPFDEKTSLFFALGLTAPTAQGEAPSADPTAKLDQNATNRFFVQHAASSTRGLESDAYFAYRRFGVSPRFAFDVRPFVAPLTFTAQAKLELLFDTSGDASHALASDGVLGVNAAYRPNDVLTLSLRAFAVVPLAGRDEHRVALVVGPDVRAEGRRFLGAIGLILPLVGPTTDPRYTGVHVLVGVKF